MSEQIDIRLLNPKEVAEILGIGKSTVYKKADTGDLRCVSFGRSKRFLPEDVIDYIQKNRSDYGEKFPDLSFQP